MDEITNEIVAALQERLGIRVHEFLLPPPSFTLVQGTFVDYDVQDGRLSARFPVLEQYLNPYGAMQGGLIAAAVDNTLGPLSMLVAPPNVTRRLEITYSRPATLDMDYITVSARLASRDGRWLEFRADVRDSGGTRLARAKARHWILEE